MRLSIMVFSFVFIIAGSQTFSQQFVTIKGTISDNSTNAFLTFAQVSVTNSTIGVASTTDGKFEINIPTEHLNDSLIVYYLGYESYKGKIAEMTGGENSIRMRPVVLSLSEIEVVGLTPQEVIRRAVANIPGNYGSGPLILTAFIRVQKMINNRLAEFAEAIVNDRKDGYYPVKEKDLAEKYKKS